MSAGLSLPLTCDASIELEATEAKAVGAVRVLAQLDYSEEAIAVQTELVIDYCVDLESEGASLRPQVSVLMVKLGLVRIELVLSLVDANVEHIPALAIQ